MKIQNQRSKRFPESGVQLSEDLDKKLQALSLNVETAEIASIIENVRDLLSLNSISQQSKALNAIIPRLQTDGDESFQVVLILLLELLYAKNSHPLHRQLLSGLKGVGQADQSKVHEALQDSLLQRINPILSGGGVDITTADTGNNGLPHYYNAMQLAISLSSILSFPEYSPAIQPLAVPLLRCMTLAVAGVANSSGQQRKNIPKPGDITNDASNLQSSVPQAVDVGFIGEAIGCMYALATRYNVQLMNEHAREVIVQSAEALISMLQKTITGSEIMASVAATLHVLLVIPVLDAPTLSHIYSTAYFESYEEPLEAKGYREHLAEEQDTAAPLWVLGGFHKNGRCLISELQKTTPDNQAHVIRGLVQCIPPSVLYADISSHSGDESEVKCFVTDGALMTMCKAAEAASDLAQKLGALQCLNVCLDQIKSFWVEIHKTKDCINVGNTSLVPTLSDVHCSRLSKLLWTSFDDKSAHAVRAAGAAFSTLLDILDLQASHPEGVRYEGNGGTMQFVENAARELLASPPARRGRYAPLTSLIPRIGSKNIVAMQPDLVQQCLSALTKQASTDITLCGPIASMLRVLWQGLIEHEQQSSNSKQKWRTEWATSLMPGLCGDDDLLRNYISIYIVPVVLELDPDALPYLLAATYASNSPAAVAASVALLKCGRKLRLIDDLRLHTTAPSDDTTLVLKEENIAEMLLGAAEHANDSVRCDVIELACSHPKTLDIPSALDLDIIYKVLMSTMRCPIPSTRQKVLVGFKKFIARVKACTEAVSVRPKDFPEDAGTNMQRCCQWTRRLSLYLIGCLYPGANYEREYMALAVLNILLEGLCDCSSVACLVPAGGIRKSSDHDIEALQAFLHPVIFSSGTIKLLLDSELDPWDKIREAASQALKSLPTPLPGYTTAEAVTGLVKKAVDLVHNPRLGESEAGARILLIVLQQYVSKLGWRIKPGNAVQRGTVSINGGGSADIVVKAIQENTSTIQKNTQDMQLNATAVFEYIESTMDMVQDAILVAEKDLLSACRKSLAHGPLMALRFMVASIPWQVYSKSPALVQQTQKCLTRLLRLLNTLSDIAIPILATPEENNVGAQDVDDIVTAIEQESSVDGSGVAPTAQIIVCACWLTLKELSLLLGTLSQVLPLHKDSNVELLTFQQFKEIGELLLYSLCVMKHNGAVDKTQVGFIAVCARLLKETRSPEVTSLPVAWLSFLLSHIHRPGQSRSDIVRRSAGIPFVIVGIFLSQTSCTIEEHGNRKELIKYGMRNLLESAAGRSDIPLPPDGMNIKGLKTASSADVQAEDPWPSVHAFNTLRMAFSDTKLTMQTSGFCAQGLELSMLGLAAPQWEVRNAATLCYTALVTRVCGFNNLDSREVSCVKAMTAEDFFAQYPSLHGFLLRQLEMSTTQLLDTGNVHPALAPVLALLNRLVPLPGSKPETESFIHTNTMTMFPNGGVEGEDGSVCAFLPLLAKCCSARQLAIRTMAASACAAFIPWEDRSVVAKQLLAAFTQSARISQPDSHIAASSVPTTLSQQRGVLELLETLAAGLNESSKSQTVNGIHGNMLMLRHMLHNTVKDIHASSSVGDGALSGASNAAAQKMLQDVLNVVLKPEMACSMHLCNPLVGKCPAISLEMIRIVTALSALVPVLNNYTLGDKEYIANECEDKCGLLESAAQFCRVSFMVPGASSNDEQPMLSVALKKATEAYFLRLFPYILNESTTASFGNRLVDDVMAALSNGAYEVRGAVLKALVKATMPTNPKTPYDKCASYAMRSVLQTLDNDTKDALGAILSVHAGCEKNHKALRRTLQLLSVYPPPLSSPGSDLFDIVLYNAQQSTEPGIKRAAVESLGAFIPRLLDDYTVRREDLQSIIQILVKESDPWQLSEQRLAVAETIHAGGLLALHTVVGGREEVQHKELTSAGLTAWIIIIQLMDDEDLDVREASALAASAILHGSTSTAKYCTDQLLRQTFKYMEDQFGENLHFIEQLMEWTCDVNGCQAQIESVCAARRERTGRKLFNKEAANNHEELLFRSHLSASTLVNILLRVGMQGESNAASIVQWFTNAVTTLENYWGMLLNDIRECPDWEDAECFVALYRLWLATWCFSRAVKEHKSYLPESQATLATILQKAVESFDIEKHRIVPQLKSIIVEVANVWSVEAFCRDGETKMTSEPVWNAVFLI